MSIFPISLTSTRQGSGGALTDRRIEASSAESAPRSGPRRAPGTQRGTRRVYGATPEDREVGAEAQYTGAGSRVMRGAYLSILRPHGSAAGGIAGRIVNRRCGSRFDRRRWSR